MRWRKLFEDMDSQWAAARQVRIEGEAAEEAQLLRARTSHLDGLLATGGSTVRIYACTGRMVEGICTGAGADWLVLDRGPEEFLIPAASIIWWEGPGGVRRGPVEGRRSALALPVLLRSLARHREPVRLLYPGGGGEEKSEGLIDGVGADYLQLAVVPDGEAGTPARGSARRVFPLTGIGMLAHRGSA